MLKHAIHVSSMPSLALEYDLNTLNGIKNDDNERWQSILEIIRTNVQFDNETLKKRRIFALNNMAAWEQDEYEREQRHEQAKSQKS